MKFYEAFAQFFLRRGSPQLHDRPCWLLRSNDQEGKNHQWVKARHHCQYLTLFQLSEGCFRTKIAGRRSPILNNQLDLTAPPWALRKDRITHGFQPGVIAYKLQFFTFSYDDTFRVLQRGILCIKMICPLRLIRLNYQKRGVIHGLTRHRYQKLGYLGFI